MICLSVNLNVINLNKIGSHVAFVSPKGLTIIKVMQSEHP